MPKPEKELLVLTEDEANAIIKSTMGSYGIKAESIPEMMRNQAKTGLIGLVNALQLMGWTIERPKK